MKVAVIGANGQLGMDVIAECGKLGMEAAGLSHSDIDISSLESVRSALGNVQPGIIVNTAAMHHVENCEKEPARAHEVNALGSQNLAVVAQELDAKLVHVSTDYVFDGLKQAPYVEGDKALPLNVYGSTKLAGEELIQQTGGKYFIMRTSALYGKNPCRAKGGKNFVDLMLKLAGERDELTVVNDEFVSPTATAGLAKQIMALAQTEHYGLYHATAEGNCTWYEFAKTIFEMSNVQVKLKVAGPNDFPIKVPRPKYSVLENEKLKKLGINTFAPWQDDLAIYLGKHTNNQNGDSA